MPTGDIQYTRDVLIGESERITNAKLIRAISGGRWRVKENTISNRELASSVIGAFDARALISADFTSLNLGLNGNNYFPFNVSSDRVADLYSDHLDLDSDADGVGLILTFHRVNGDSQLRIRAGDSASPPDKKILSIDGETLYNSGQTSGLDMTGDVRVVQLMYVGQSNALGTDTIDSDIRWLEIRRD